MIHVLLIITCCMFFHEISFSQNNVFAFLEYKIKDGMEDQFINGYARDLEWHKSQDDDWSWVGWFILNGNRRDRFIDATPDHNWSDFDNWKIDLSENLRLNQIHWVPYVKDASGSYRKILDEFSSYKKGWFKSNFLQVYTIEVTAGEERCFKKFLTEQHSILKEKLNDNSFVWMKTTSGGSISEYFLFIALTRIEELELCENLFDFSESDALKESYTYSVRTNMSELWRYSEQLSMIRADYK